MTSQEQEMVTRVATIFARYADGFLDEGSSEPSDAEWSDFSPREQLMAKEAARAAIEAIDGWSDDFSKAPHDVSLWVYATDDKGYAYGPASIWDSGSPEGPILVWNYDGKRRPINDGIERALLWHLVPQWPGEERLQVALRASLSKGTKRRPTPLPTRRTPAQKDFANRLPAEKRAPPPTPIKETKP